MLRRLLLLSNSTSHGYGYLDHAEEAVRENFEGVGEILFVPYALHDHDGYTRVARERFAAMEIDVRGVHEFDDPAAAVESAQGVFIGGGNTFRLLSRLYEHGLVELLRRRVLGGMPYMGASAGTNVACLSIRTTNDMPIVYPPSFDALGLVPFNINPHYIDPEPSSTHMGETREQRIREFHEENTPPVIGLREGAWLRVRGADIVLGGRSGARVFARDSEPRELAPGESLASEAG